MVTITEVARHAGVSPTTVSHVINHADRVSARLRDKVNASIEELGYAPSPEARSLRTGRTGLASVLIPDIMNPFYTELVRAIQTQLELRDLDTLVFNTDVPGGRSVDHGREYLAQIRRRRVEALIVADFALHGIHDELQRMKMPVVFIGVLSQQSVDSVRVDDRGGAALIGQHFADRGWRRAGIVTGPEEFTEAGERTEGFVAALSEAGIEVRGDWRFPGDYLHGSGARAADWWAALPADDRPEALFLANSAMAIGALARLHDLGISVPDDLKIATFDDIAAMDFVRPRLTSAGARPELLAEAAGALLFRRLDAGDEAPPPTAKIIPCRLRPGDTA
jgi:DNA-binding LacI/PurR family transcriptional regulator